jgi:hypothetical protein
VIDPRAEARCLFFKLIPLLLPPTSSLLPLSGLMELDLFDNPGFIPPASTAFFAVLHRWTSRRLPLSILGLGAAHVALSKKDQEYLKTALCEKLMSSSVVRLRIGALQGGGGRRLLAAVSEKMTSLRELEVCVASGDPTWYDQALYIRIPALGLACRLRTLRIRGFPIGSGGLLEAFLGKGGAVWQNLHLVGFTRTSGLSPEMLAGVLVPAARAGRLPCLQVVDMRDNALMTRDAWPPQAMEDIKQVLQPPPGILVTAAPGCKVRVAQAVGVGRLD